MWEPRRLRALWPPRPVTGIALPHYYKWADWSRNCGIFDVSEPYGPPLPVTGIALPHYYKWATCIKMCEPRRLRTLWASTACYGDSLLNLLSFRDEVCGVWDRPTHKHTRPPRGYHLRTLKKECEEMQIRKQLYGLSSGKHHSFLTFHMTNTKNESDLSWTLHPPVATRTCKGKRQRRLGCRALTE
jgi:hypothetical protein